MRWLVTGAGGLLGRHLAKRLNTDSAFGDEVVALRRAELDITDPNAVAAAFEHHRPDIVVNCAAYTRVEQAEAEETEALRINGEGPRILAAACARSRARLLHVSTDYVFSGRARTPYPEGHPPDPQTAYGRSKLAGERAVASLLPVTGTVVRTAWLYGTRGRGFVKAMVDRALHHDEAVAVDDQWGQPTWADDAAGLLVVLGRSGRAHGIFHATDSGAATRLELAREIFRTLGADPGLVRRAAPGAFVGPAPRADYTVLGHDRWSEIGAPPPRPWKQALHQALSEMFPERVASAKR